MGMSSTVNILFPSGAGKSMMQTGVAGILLVLVLLAGPPAAWAHKVYVFAWVEKGGVHTESSFGDRQRRISSGSSEAKSLQKVQRKRPKRRSGKNRALLPGTIHLRAKHRPQDRPGGKRMKRPSSN